VRPKIIIWRAENDRAVDFEQGLAFAAFSRRDAENLLLHGYYLACATLHVTLDWPLLAGLDTHRLSEYFQAEH
jgi:hypothetical protein